MLPSFCQTSVTVTRPASVTSRGSTVRDYSNGATTSISGCQFQPRGTYSDERGRYNTELDGVLYAPSGADIKAGDRVTVGGVIYSVVGEPKNWTSPTGAASHKIIELAVFNG